MKKILLFLSVLFLLTACKQPPPLPEISPTPAPTPRPSPSSKPAPDEYKDYDLISKIDGSTATIPLSEELLLNRLGNYDGLKHNRTHDAYLNLINGQSDLIFVTYPSVDELAEAERKGVELEIIPVVKDALVFLSNTANDVENLTGQQIRDIYTGKTTNWNQVGGKNEPIAAFQRPENSGSQTLFLKLAMDGLTPTDPPQELRPMEMGGLIDAVADYNNANNALGFSVFYYVSDMYGNADVRLMAVDGITPTRNTIAAGTYPYITYYYAVMRKDTPENHPVRELIDWLLTDEGQNVAQSAGYVPMRVLSGRLDESGYGFYGSTPENTTKSSGTGGTEQKTNDIFSIKWRNAEDMYSIDLSPYPKLERMTNLWTDQAMQSLGAYESTNISYDLTGDLLSVIIHAYYQGGRQERRAAAVFDLSEGKRVKLSDIFYNNVNYIEYINNLLRGKMDADYTSEQNERGYSLKRAFTGIPNDYAEFSVVNYFEGPVLYIYFDYNNPFFDNEYNISSAIPLPADLSPWGLLYSKSNDRMDVNDDLEIAIPQIQTGTKLSPIDDEINAKIREIANEAASNNSIEVDKEMLERTREHYGNSQYKEKYLPVVNVWNDNITVGYSAIAAYNEGFSFQDFIITVNLRTGETVDAAKYIPANWTEIRRHSEVDGKFDENYTPPEGSAIENVFIQRGLCTFTVVEPEGRRVPVRVFYG